jgi:hypothetical protein
MFPIACMVMVFVLTQTVSHSFPKVFAALQREFGTDATYRAGCGYVFGTAPAMRRHLPNRELAGLVGVTHRTCTMPGAMRRPSSRQVLPG